MSDVRLWQDIDYRAAVDLYNRRYDIHQRLLALFHKKDVVRYVNLALGIEEAGGNYTAADPRHHLGSKILAESSPERVFQLAEKLFATQDPQRVLGIILEESIPYLKVGVGSEMGMLLKPDLFWTCNTRTIWAHFAMKSGVQDANDIVQAYHEGRPSDMDYPLWKETYPLVGPSMVTLASLGTQIAQSKGLEPGTITFLWADAIADTAYNLYSH